MKTERLLNGWTWWRIARAEWTDPLDPDFARRRGGRWNPPDSFDTLYLNEDRVTARMNLRAFIAGWPYEPEDLRSDTGPVLVGASLPRDQDVCDVHTPAGVSAVGLPRTYPLDGQGRPVGHDRCQPIGRAVKARELRGVRARSARSAESVPVQPLGVGRAPVRGGRRMITCGRTARSRARTTLRLPFDDWYW